MKQKLTPRRLVLILTGFLFAAYAAYYLYIFIKDFDTLRMDGKFISALLVALFGILTAYAWTVGVKSRRFLFFRRIALIIVLAVLFALKLRMISRVTVFFVESKMESILYCGSYFLTLAALMILFIYYAFIRDKIPFFPKAAFLLPLSAMLLFLCALVMEILLFFIYGIGLEANALRTIVSRPIFYLSFIGLSAYYLPIPKKTKKQ